MEETFAVLCSAPFCVSFLFRRAKRLLLLQVVVQLWSSILRLVKIRRPQESREPTTSYIVCEYVDCKGRNRCCSSRCKLRTRCNYNNPIQLHPLTNTNFNKIHQLPLTFPRSFLPKCARKRYKSINQSAAVYFAV